MKRIYILCLCIMALCSLSSCNKNNRFKEDFLGSCQDVGLFFSGQAVFQYDPLTCQMGWSEDMRQFRASDDNMNSFYVLDMNRLPGGVDSSVRGILTWTTDTDVRQRQGVDFKVVRVEDDMYWLWNRSGGIGAVVRVIR